MRKGVQRAAYFLYDPCGVFLRPWLRVIKRNRNNRIVSCFSILFYDPMGFPPIFGCYIFVVFPCFLRPLGRIPKYRGLRAQFPRCTGLLRRSPPTCSGSGGCSFPGSWAYGGYNSQGKFKISILGVVCNRTQQKRPYGIIWISLLGRS